MAADDATETPDDVAMTGGDDTAVEQLTAQFQTYLSAVKDADDSGDAMQLCIEAGEEFAQIEVDADNDDTTERVNAMAKAYLNELSDAKSGVARKTVRSLWTDKIDALEQKRQIEEGEDVRFAVLLSEKLEAVTKKITTDESGQDDTEYELVFSDEAELTVTQTTLFDGRLFWQAYTSKYGEYPTRSDNDERSTWDNFMGGLINDVEEDVEKDVGPRTAALKSLENHVATSTAYGDLADAVERGGVWVDDEPPDHSEVAVPREAVASIVSAHEISDRKLQLELSARGVTGESVDGDTVSESTTVNGHWQTLWYLSGDRFDEVGKYEEEYTDGMDRMPARDVDGDGDDGTDAGGDGTDTTDTVNDGGDAPDDASEDGDDEPGRTGSFGGSDGGDE